MGFNLMLTVSLEVSSAPLYTHFWIHLSIRPSIYWFVCLCYLMRWLQALSDQAFLVEPSEGGGRNYFIDLIQEESESDYYRELQKTKSFVLTGNECQLAVLKKRWQLKSLCLTSKLMTLHYENLICKVVMKSVNAVTAGPAIPSLIKQRE